jgi:alkanesulfonate monooxygenase SsuD/methylene tetrahydromethanopterin reductase-like flavin-dependent oxidoreductase (luciferase family)
MVRDRQSTQLIGTPQTVRAGLADLRARTEADELMITTQTHDPADRRRSFQLAAEAARS